MYTVVGLGGIGCKIAKRFEDYSQYNVLYIDDDSGWAKEQVTLKKRNSPEEYENNYSSMRKTFLDKIKEDVIVVLSGASLVSAVSLRLLYQIRGKSITILYIQPEVDLLEDVKKKQEKVIRSVLQEYTRSGVFEKMYLVSNESVDALVQNASIKDYYPAINGLISSVFHMLMVFDHQESEVSSFSRVREARRVCTLGVLDLEKGIERSFFPMDNMMETRLYYGISNKSLNENRNLQRDIIKLIKEKNTELSKYSYGVYETQYEEDFCYFRSYTSKVQETE